MSHFKTLFHICLFSNDLEKTLDFYKKLGIEVIFSMKEHEGEEAWNYYLKVAHGQYLEVQPVNSPNPHPHPARVQYHENQAAWHFALETDNMAEMIRDLTGKGLELYKNPENTIDRVYSMEDAVLSADGCYVCWIIDPDGMPIELMEQTPGSLQHQNDPE